MAFSTSPQCFYLVFVLCGNQEIVAQINQAIGVNTGGAMNKECKPVVQQYGKQIVALLQNKVAWTLALFFYWLSLSFHPFCITIISSHEQFIATHQLQFMVHVN